MGEKNLEFHYAQERALILVGKVSLFPCLSQGPFEAFKLFTGHVVIYHNVFVC